MIIMIVHSITIVLVVSLFLLGIFLITNISINVTFTGFVRCRLVGTWIDPPWDSFPL